MKLLMDNKQQLHIHRGDQDDHSEEEVEETEETTEERTEEELSPDPWHKTWWGQILIGLIIVIIGGVIIYILGLNKT